MNLLEHESKGAFLINNSWHSREFVFHQRAMKGRIANEVVTSISEAKTIKFWAIVKFVYKRRYICCKSSILVFLFSFVIFMYCKTIFNNKYKQTKNYVLQNNRSP